MIARIFPSSLRARLLFMVLLAVLPAFGVILFGAARQRHASAEAVESSVRSLVSVVVNDQEQTFEQTHRLLETLSHLPGVRSRTPQGCKLIFAAILQSDPRYMGLLVLGEDGTVLCSTREFPVGMRPAPAVMEAVRVALAKGDFAISRYTLGQVSNRPLITFAHAIPPEPGAAPAVVYASMGLEWLNRFASQVSLPEGSSLTVLDPSGTVLVRTAESEAGIGSRVPDSELSRAVLASQAYMTYTASGVDGVERLYASAPLRNPDGAVHGFAIIGVPTSVIFGEQRRFVRESLVLLAILVLVAGLAAWFGGEFFVLRRVNALVGATRRLQAGDRTARTGVPAGAGELEQLAHAFDEMAETLQKRQEEDEEIAAILRRQALVFDTLNEGVVVTDPEGRIIEWNVGAERLFGYTRAEMIGERPAVFHDPATYGALEEEIIRVVTERGRWSGEVPFVRRDGTSGISEAVVVAQYDGDGRRVAQIGVNRDITERKAAEQALRDSEASYRSLFGSITEGVFIEDFDGRILDVNHAVTAMLGYSHEEIIGRHADIFTEADDADAEERARRLEPARAGQMVRFERRMQRRNGESFPMEVVLSRATHHGQDVIIAVARDISDRVRAAEALRQSEEQLRQAQKMEAVGRLAGGVAHDFNNLLTAIRGNVEIALLDLPQSSPLREEMEQIQKSADTAASLTRQLLAFSRRQTVQLRALDLNEVLGSTTRLLQRLLGPDMELQTILVERPWPIRADSGQLEQVIMNLAVNARDAMPEGGWLSIETRRLEFTADDPARPSYVAPGRYVGLSVSDTGYGMDAATQQRIFEPFFTTKEQGKGTGLGLFTVYGIVNQSGGHIWVESTPDVGTTFHLIFPAVDAALEPARVTEREGTLHGGAETVLLVEDEPSVRLLANRLLHRIGYHVIEASNGEEALRVSSQYQGTIHLMLTDMTMPRMGGRELALHMARTRPAMKIVYMSGYTEDVLPAGVAGGPSGPFIHKPFTLGVLANTVREALDAAG